MSRRPSALVSPEQAEGNASVVARAHPLDIERDRPKRIDQYIDYFGGGTGRPFPEDRATLDR
jgi:hypothetical protein